MDLKEFCPKIEKEQSEYGTPPGRKFLMGRYTLLLATLAFLATALSAPLSVNFVAFIGGLATLFGIYCGGNVSQKWVDNKPTTKVIMDRRRATPKPEVEPIQDGPGPSGG